MIDEANYICPSCGEDIVIPVDQTQGLHQEYVEDCPICCRPVIIRLEFNSGGEVSCQVEIE